MDVPGSARTRVPRGLARELRLVRGAIELVAIGAASRVSVAGLQHGPELVEPALAMAAEAGVRLVPRLAAGERVAGIAIELDHDA